MRIALIAGARPNFMKIAPIIKALQARQHDNWFLVHTGQHYDAKLSDVFFKELGMPEPDVWLGVGSGSHAEQTAKVMIGIEKVFLERRPDLVLVVGDVNSTLAASLVASKLGIKLVHVEAGLRSGDRTMPEEINRIVTDVLADMLFTTSEDAHEHLAHEGIANEKIFFVGNVMVDSLLSHLPVAAARTPAYTPKTYAVLTLHRPSNVDRPEVFARLMRAIDTIAQTMPVIFPVHPRTAERVAALPDRRGDIRTTEPMGYLDFLSLTSNASVILTDSGGLQEESTVLGIPCLTLRENTERPVTITHGTNRLIGTDEDAIVRAFFEVTNTPLKSGSIPPLWDGHASERIVDNLLGTR
jgi:UDP-N-acetylglucosamine 2-epimerase (non-hydrolysing)